MSGGFPYTFPFEFYVEDGGIWCFIDWDGDGDFDEDNENVSEYLRDYFVERGRDSNMGRAIVGNANITLKDVAGTFIPSSTVSSLAGYIIPGRKVKLSRYYKGTEYTLFTGYLDDIQNDYGETVREAYFSCTDGSERLNTIIIDSITSVKEDINSGECIIRALQIAGYTTGSISYSSTDVRIDTGDYLYGFFWPHGVSVRKVITDFEDSEAGFFYFSRDGKATWETLDHRSTYHSTSEWTCDGTIWRSLKTQNNWKDVTNKVTMKGAPKFHDGSASAWAVWTSPEATTGSPFLVEESCSRPFWANTYDQKNVQQKWTWVFLSITANGSSAGGGVDKSANFSYSTDYVNYGDTFFFHLVNSSSNAYVSALSLRGRTWTDGDTITVVSESTASQDIYGIRERSYDLAWYPSSSEIAEVADARVAAGSTVVPTYAVEIVPNSSDALQHALDLDISDRFTLQDSRISLSRDVYIDKVQHKWSVMDGVHHTNWTVSCAT